jgi:hypothetical protein
MVMQAEKFSVRLEANVIKKPTLKVGFAKLLEVALRHKV